MASRARSLVLVLVVAIAVFVRLGLWQLERLDERRTINRRAEARRNAPPLDLNTGGATIEAADRRVVLRGRYDRAHELVIRNQSYRGSPGVHLITPLRLPGRDTAVLVNRGFVPAPDAVTVDVAGLDEPGEVEVRGVAFPLPEGDDGRPVERQGRTTWSRLTREAVRRAVPYPVAAVYVLQSPDPGLPSFPRRVEPPPLDDGPHLSYAVQWFAFAAIAATFAVVVWRKGVGKARDVAGDG
ncbi:MAG TPA: SURF1 family protein [Gemmatimonadales bacterium]|nr:SURF1 family protein [Gemmatimonadales bacterium]